MKRTSVVYVAQTEEEGEALYLDGKLVYFAPILDAQTVLCFVHDKHIAVGAGILKRKYFMEECHGRFPPTLDSVPLEEWYAQDIPTLCEVCGNFRSNGDPC